MLKDNKIYPNNTYTYSIKCDKTNKLKTYTISNIGTPNPLIKLETTKQNNE